jgi:hypothetical protein
MRALDRFRDLPPEFWALVKLVSREVGYSERGTGRIKRYRAEVIAGALEERGLDPRGHDSTLELAAAYVHERADLLERHVRPYLMDREEARAVFEKIRAEVSPPSSLIAMNRQRGEKRHEAYLTCIVNMLTYSTLTSVQGKSLFEHDPKASLTFAAGGMPLRTLFRRMDGAYPNVNHPHATWEIKEYYGTTTFGSRVADGVYETALDGYELNELRAVGIEVEHYLFLDDRFTWWDCGRSYLARIVDMLHIGLLDAAFFGREVLDIWPGVVATWP